MGTTMGIIVGILILSLLMFIHELGHYMTGRILGFKIIEFSLFMGPVLLSKTSKKTGIKYSLKLLPIGASVRFDGESGMGEDDSDDSDSFAKKQKWKRAVVIGTGPVINILAGVLALLILFGSIGFTSTIVAGTYKNSQAQTAGLIKGDKVVMVNDSKIWTSIDYSLELSFAKQDSPMTVSVIRPGETTQRAFTLKPIKQSSYKLGVTTQIDEKTNEWRIIAVDKTSNGGKPTLLAGDVILSINGVSTVNQEKSSLQVSNSGGKSVLMVVLRDKKEVTVASTPSIMELYNDRGIGFEGKTGIGEAIPEAFKYSASIVKLTFKGLAMIITGKIAAKDGLSGPVGVVDMVGTVVNQQVPFIDKIANLLWMFALISLNLGVFNLLPIPALDGSHLLLIVVEAIRGKRLSQKVESAIVMAGFFLIIGLAILGLVFDIMRISGR